ncbi:sce7726 family protein [Vibrio navarrensis]
MKINDLKKLPALTRLFSAAVFREMARKGQSALFTRLLKEAGIVDQLAPNATVGEAFDFAFNILKVAGYRDEYIYRAAVSQKVLLGTHSLRTASMLSEFRAGSCKADLVILNGTATVYEIKSERDSLTRLEHQVENYKRVFAKVNVISSEEHIDGILKAVPEDVGIMCLTKRYQIQTMREALNCPERICPSTVFDSLRISECVEILESLGIAVPVVPNIERHAVLRKLFSEIDPATLHFEMVKTLKRTRDLASLRDFVDRLPKSLQTAALSVSVRLSDQTRLIDATETPLHAAMTWS